MTRSGFTLLEMMIALLVFSIIAAAGAAVLGSGIQSKEILDARQARLNDVILARAIMKSDFIQLADRPIRTDRTGDARQGFTGGDRGASEPLMLLVRRGWVNPGNVEPRASMQTVEYWFDGKKLTRKAYDRLDPVEDTPSLERVLLEGVSKLTVSFYRNGEWTDQWFSRPGISSLPAMVAIEMELAGIGPLRHVFLTSELGR